MELKWMGAVLVIMGCGGFGFSLAASYRREVLLLRQLRQSLRFMRSELQYRLTPLPELCRLSGKEVHGTLRKIYMDFSQELEKRSLPDPGDCMAAALQNCRDPLPGNVRKLLFRLGRSLGRFDMAGQIRGLEALCAACDEELLILNKNKDVRLRNYQTLGLCAGAALVILFV